MCKKVFSVSSDKDVKNVSFAAITREVQKYLVTVVETLWFGSLYAKRYIYGISASMYSLCYNTAHMLYHPILLHMQTSALCFSGKGG